MERKGFTLVELLVVIAIIALLMSILMPALARVKQLAYRLACGTNLSGIGKAMLIYANDYEDELPRGGGRDSGWVNSLGNGWSAGSRYAAFGINADGSGGNATIASCFYLLVKYSDVTPQQFLCKGDSGAVEFKLSDYGVGSNFELTDAWDFGPEPTKHCSYCYHIPFGLYALTSASEPGMAVAADRNPWLDSPGLGKRDDTTWNRFNPGSNESALQKLGNALTHQEDGQNVLFMDGHVDFEKRSYCAIEDDNIYTRCTRNGYKQKGLRAVQGDGPEHLADSLLIHDGEMIEPPPKQPPQACFPADTPIWVDGSLVQISKVTFGHNVGKLDSTGAGVCLAQSEVLQPIEKVEEHEGTFECYDIVLENGNSISVVDYHVFQLDSERWVAVQDLRSSSKLKSLKGPIIIRSVVKRQMPFTGKVYNLKVKNSERYFVGEDGVVVRDW